MNEYEEAKKFVQERIDESKSLPTLELAARQILQHATELEQRLSWWGAYLCLFAITGVWRHHPDYQGWADDE